jgi:Zn-dependent peptidase ImmA (M78 family)
VIRAKFVEAQALELLASADVSRPPVPVERLAVHLAVAIEERSDLRTGVRALFRHQSRTIAVAPLDPRSRRFAIAHELGHLVLDHGGACSFEGEPSIDTFALEDADVRIDEEREADEFAGRLLVPRAWLRDRVAHQGRDELLDAFDVNSPVLLIAADRYRLVNKLRV